MQNYSINFNNINPNSIKVRSEIRSITRSMSLNCGVDHFRIRKTLESVMRMLDIRSK